MRSTVELEVMALTSRRMLVPFVLAAMLTVAFGSAATADGPKPAKATAKHAQTEARPVNAKVVSQLLPSMKPGFCNLIRPNKTGLPSGVLAKVLAENLAKLMSNNIAKFLADNAAAFMSGNTAQLLSGNPGSEITLKAMSDNTAEFASRNSAKLLSENTTKLFSDIKILSGINVNVDIRMQNSVNTNSKIDGQDTIDSTFRQFDQNGDGKISPREFREALGNGHNEHKP
ncbi:MAG: hypothetical protein JW888_04555 [Pirellulales bacterium]|nr:hypothetical protein [Pirellulales bacterium]